ncbi:hypothetical protein AJ80_04577 [Polytolypa hystricis UAMH7299]|uniref:Protein farnesyltransferase/geranylgeranyltransferase type-1 subunit alpha n=1 Tax=Polytolypa hystricis (strain UAMH7299) TaxID=1447883 RepID=A0A2B7YAH3_POLH7|nr:hypothetical protein AJ80_04577 [Polytolypa hystricis UAMH7299]
MSKYSQDPAWSSVTPIPLDDGSTYYSEGHEVSESSNGTYPLATIAYAPEYVEAMAYLRAVMAANEMSDRALELTSDVIMMNPAHYTVWLYRAKILLALEKDLHMEIEWVNRLASKHLKNYQIWHHRQMIMSNRKTFPTLPVAEPDFLMEMFKLDAKNYHVWTYRHWLVRHFKLWDSPREIQDVEKLINEDVRNNSAWNHRWLLKFGPRGSVDSGVPNPTNEFGNRGKLDVVDEDFVDAELEYVKSKAVLAPENKSPWAYARGVLRASGRPMSELKKFAAKFVIEEIGEDGEVKFHVKSSVAVEWLADVYAEEAQVDGESVEKERKAEAVKMLKLLKEKYDPLRKNYWDYRIQSLDKERSAA